MTIRTGATMLQGAPVDLAGTELRVGDTAPDFSIVNFDLDDVTLGASDGKTRILATIPSLDTSVCHTETVRFNQEAAQIGDVVVLCISMDLPFGQKRWCGSEGVERVSCLSAHRSTAFGESYGVLIHGGAFDRLLSRAVFVIDPERTLTHVEYVGEIADEPDYEAALAAARSCRGPFMAKP